MGESVIRVTVDHLNQESSIDNINYPIFPKVFCPSHFPQYYRYEDSLISGGSRVSQNKLYSSSILNSKQDAC